MSSGNTAHRQAGHVASILRRRIQGEVRFDDGSRALYATDASNYRQIPIGVVVPKTIDDVIATVAVCYEHGLPVLPRGGGTSLAGQCCNVAVVIDTSRYLNNVISIDTVEKTAEVQPGVVLDRLRETAEQYHLTFAPDPSTHAHCTLGGMLGNNACGAHSVMAGRTSDNVIELEILTYDGLRMTVGATPENDLDNIIDGGGRRGEIYNGLRQLRDEYQTLIRERTPDIPRRVSGFNLDELLEENGFNIARSLVGSEGTCALILKAKLRLVDSPPARALLVLGYSDIYAAADRAPDIMQHQPTALEGIDRMLANDMRRCGLYENDLALLPKGEDWLMVEFGGGDSDEAVNKAENVLRRVRDDPHLVDGIVYGETVQAQKVWNLRQSGLGATSHAPKQTMTWPGWEDAAVPPEHLGGYLREFRGLMDQYGYRGGLYGHFGQGCIHVRIDFDLDSDEGIARYRRFVEEAARLVVKYNGSLSGEHGDGQARGELLGIMYGSEMIEAFRRFKKLWDPNNKMNPGKVVDPEPLDSHLRVRGMLQPGKQVATFFKYPADAGHFNKTLLRCVGVGKCRKSDNGTMCPSYMVTREEQYSTRGRAHLLFEMLKGEVIKDGWRSEAARHALDLCLSCKACRTECPVGVDMATYKSEFFYHYYQHKHRPLNAWLFGRIDSVAKWMAKLPALSNFISQNPLSSVLIKRTLGIAPSRELPRFQSPTFINWFHQRQSRHNGSHEVILWPDTFNNYFSTDVAQAAVEVLETLGYKVNLPVAHICCGRPLYEFGWLDLAKQRLQQIMQILNEPLQRGVPLIALEPSCLAVFRDELLNLFPGDQSAERLSQNSYTLGEFLQRENVDLPKLNKNALAHLHCNHKYVLGTDADHAVIEALGLDCEFPDSGCCGMAGAFGYEKEKYPVSLAVVERKLLPAIRGCSADTLLIADGYSCREQIRQQTNRQPLHLAEVVRMALKYSAGRNAS